MTADIKNQKKGRYNHYNVNTISASNGKDSKGEKQTSSAPHPPENNNKKNAHRFDDSVKILRFDDGATEWEDLPVFGKSRRTTSPAASNITKKARNNGLFFGSSILWDFDYATEFDLVESGLVEQMDKPLFEKFNKAIWQGGLGTKGPLSASLEFNRRYEMVRSSSLNKEASTTQLVDAIFVIPQDELHIIHQNDT